MDIKEAQKGDKKAKEQLILENQKLVMKIAAKYNREKIFDIEDLISEGNVGLMNAIKEYDASKDVQFSTYAVFWIKK